jgi:heme-degrading monooxygenase HmoA
MSRLPHALRRLGHLPTKGRTLSELLRRGLGLVSNRGGDGLLPRVVGARVAGRIRLFRLAPGGGSPGAFSPSLLREAIGPYPPLGLALTHALLVVAASVEVARTLYNSEEVSGVLDRQKGYRFHYLLESVDVPGEGVSVTAWDGREDAEAYERSGAYEELVAKFRNFYTRPPRLASYEVHE